MAKKKPSRLRGAVKALAQVKAIYLHDFVVANPMVPPEWLKSPIRPTASELDLLGIRVEVEFDDDTYNFGLDLGPEVFTCVDVLEQWHIEAQAKVEAGGVKVATLARRCGVTRQSLYNLTWGGRSPQHYFALRGRSPTLLWQGKPLDDEYERCLPELEAVGLVGSLA